MAEQGPATSWPSNKSETSWSLGNQTGTPSSFSRDGDGPDGSPSGIWGITVEA